MNSSIIGKIEKARTYAEEKDRVKFTTFAATFRGNHNEYLVGYDEGELRCSCPFFESHFMCSHTMALERILAGMLSKELKDIPA